jgi:hypothetical protein
VGNVYAPHSDFVATHLGSCDRIYERIEAIINALPSDVRPLIGGDFDASLGTRSNYEEASYLGLCGIAHRNGNGARLFETITALDLRAASTLLSIRSMAPGLTFETTKSDVRLITGWFHVSLVLVSLMLAAICI